MNAYFEGYTVTKVQTRPPFGKAQAWDGIGRTEYLHLPTAPRPEAAPNGKVREIVLSCPDERTPIVELPPGARLLQVFTMDRVALVAGAFPLDATVTSMRLGVPGPPASTLDRREPKRVPGPQGHPYGKGLVWFAASPGTSGARCHLLDGDMKTLPVAAEYFQGPDSERYLAVRADVAKRVRWVAHQTGSVTWGNFRNLLLNPAPAAQVRPDAPTGSRPLAGGGTVEVVRIALITMGRPTRSWAIDGGTPGPMPRGADSNRSSSFIGEPNREMVELLVRLRWPGQKKIDPSVKWETTGPVQSGGSGTWTHNLSDAFASARLSFPRGLAKGTVRMGYSIAPWRIAAEEPLGGKILRVSQTKTPILSSGSGVSLRFAVPKAARNLDLKFEIVDNRGKTRTPDTVSFPVSVDGRDDGRFEAHFERVALTQIARVRLKVRDWQWVELRNLPLQPR
jgi:hypothetical protein